MGPFKCVKALYALSLKATQSYTSYSTAHDTHPDLRSVKNAGLLCGLVGLRGPSWATECLGTIFGVPLVSAPSYLELLMIFPDCFASLSRFSHDALSFSFPACISFVFLFNSFKFLLDQNFTGQPRDDVSNL